MNTRKKIVSFLFTKESFMVILFFLLFSALRTQTANLMYYFFDQAFLEGIISDTFTYSYRGDLLGCEQVAKLRESSTRHNLFQRYGILYAQYLPSIIAFILLLKNNKKSRWLFWLLVVISCFSILESIIQIQSLLFGWIKVDTIEYTSILLRCILFIGIGVYILFRIMDLQERLKVVLIALPSFILGFYLWYQWIGPSILPLVI